MSYPPSSPRPQAIPGSYSLEQSPIVLRDRGSKENIEVKRFLQEDQSKGFYASSGSYRGKGRYFESEKAGSKRQRTSSFARLQAEALKINYFEFYKLKKEFKLISDEIRQYLIDDLFEFDKCFYLNQFKVAIHGEEDLSDLRSQEAQHRLSESVLFTVQENGRQFGR